MEKSKTIKDYLTYIVGIVGVIFTALAAGGFNIFEFSTWGDIGAWFIGIVTNPGALATFAVGVVMSILGINSNPNTENLSKK